MFLHALATAVPPNAYTQPQCWEIANASPAMRKLNRRSALTLRAILRGDSGVKKRHFAMPEIDRIFGRSADELNQVFRQEAPTLAGSALRSAMHKANVKPDDIDALIVTTCTGYLCPGITSYVSESLGLRGDAFLQDLVGLGCGAAVPALRAANAYLRAHPAATVATISVEMCSAAFYLDDDLGVIISACLFGDGAAAAIWKSSPGGKPLRCHAFRTVHQPEARDKIRFEQRDGKLRNLLDPAVPKLAAAAVGQLFEKEQPLGPPITQIVSHGGGKDVLDELSTAFPTYSFESARAILRDYGNMSSPSVLFALERMLEQGAPDEQGDWWLVTFGAGFSAHACRFGR